MSYSTSGGIPTSGTTLAQLIHHIDESISSAAMMAHLTRAQSSSAKDAALADGWIAVSELFKRVRHQVIEIGKGKLQ